MKCCKKKAREPKEVSLTFRREELLYDIKNYSFVEGETMSEEAGHARHHVFDIGESGNVDRVNRTLSLVHSECVEMLYPYTKEEIAEQEEAYSDRLEEPEEYGITLKLPDGFSQTTVNYLKHLIHDYLVCRVLADWLSITKPDSAENWLSKAESHKARIRAALMSRRGAVRLKLRPF